MNCGGLGQACLMAVAHSCGFSFWMWLIAQNVAVALLRSGNSLYCRFSRAIAIGV